MPDHPDPEALERARKIFAGPCDFIAGVMTHDAMIPAGPPEIAFAGRSNVGKSSLINALTGRKTLARTSQTPGCTRQINFFALGPEQGRLHLVDLPGYGYAKVSKKEAGDWNALIKDYLRGRPTLRQVLLLVDSRHGLKNSDTAIMDILDASAVSYRIILTKCDKMKAGALAVIRHEIEAALRKRPAAFPEVMDSSAREQSGLETLRAVICGAK